MTGINHGDSAVLGQPLDLPCGVRLRNRLIKSPMSDSLGDGQGNATPEQARDAETDFDLTLAAALAGYHARDAARCARWRNRFGPSDPVARETAGPV